MNLHTVSLGFLASLLAYLSNSRWLLLPFLLTNAWVLVLLWGLRSFLVYRIGKQSHPQRKALLDVVNQNKREFGAGSKSSPTSDDGEWEHVGKAATQDEKPDTSYDGFIGFFHPFANAGGGGERVLWAAIHATQSRWPNATCVVYTGDHQSTKAEILERVKNRFDIGLYPPTVLFLYLERRSWVVAASYSHFTLLLQSLGSIVVAHEALSRLTPEIFIDTMGYAFSTWYCKFLFPNITVGSYVHYPFIGTHMVASLESDSAQGVNRGRGRGLRGIGKRAYWHSLLQLYTWTGTAIDSIMTNSSWTHSHMQRIWGPSREKNKHRPLKVVYPPCSVDEIIDQVPLEGQHALPKEAVFLYIAQFRPEKNHELLIESFARMKRLDNRNVRDARLVLIGSVRDSHDETLVYKLRILVKELKVDEAVEFRINIAWDEILEWLKRASIGVNAMWCEHFGIGVVEYQAAGLICVVNNSGGPKEDIVVEYDGGPTGYHASTVDEYSARFIDALRLSPSATLAMRKRARGSSKRFTTSVFENSWAEEMAFLISLSQSRRGSRSPENPKLHAQ